MPMRNVNYCSTCAASSPNLQVETGRVCNRMRVPVKDDDFCSNHVKSTWKCECCGNEYWGNPIISMSIDEKTGAVSMIDAIICSMCNDNIWTCRTCAHIDECAFETDPSPLPKVVQKQIRQGNMTAVTQVMNPERIAITCEKNCHCWHDFSCSKQNHGTCLKYQMHRV